MTSPTITTDRYAEDLHDLFSKLFEGVLTNAARSSDEWTHRVDTFNRVSLLEFVTPSQFKPKPIEFDQDRLDDPRYRRMLVRKLQAPRPSKWVRHKLTLDRSKVADADYREKIGKVLAFKWVKLLHPIDPEALHELLPLYRADVGDLEYLLDESKLSAISARWCFEKLVHNIADRLIERNETFQKMEAMIREAGSAAREKLSASLTELRRETMVSFGESLDRIADDTRRKCDEAIEDIRSRSQESQRRTQAALDEHGIDPNEDREETFRKALLAREAEMKAERRARWRKQPLWVRLLPGASILAVSSLLLFYMEVNGATPIEWLCRLLAC